jgi:hypothetical protein
VFFYWLPVTQEVVLYLVDGSYSFPVIDFFIKSSCENSKEVVIPMEQKHKSLHRADKSENMKKVVEIMVLKSCHYW